MMRNAARRRSSFEATVRERAGNLVRLAFALCRDRQHAEALVQIAFLRAHAVWDDLGDPRVAKCWLYAHVPVEHERTDPRGHDAGSAAPHPGRHGPAQLAVDLLPPDQREALLLQCLGGFDCAAIGLQGRR